MYKLVINTQEYIFAFIFDAANAWADELDAKVYDQDGIEVSSDDLYAVLNM